MKVIQYRTCNTVGCIAQTPFDDTLAKSLKEADDMTPRSLINLEKGELEPPATTPQDAKDRFKDFT